MTIEDHLDEIKICYTLENPARLKTDTCISETVGERSRWVSTRRTLMVTVNEKLFYSRDHMLLLLLLL